MFRLFFLLTFTLRWDIQEINQSPFKKSTNPRSRNQPITIQEINQSPFKKSTSRHSRNQPITIQEINQSPIKKSTNRHSSNKPIPQHINFREYELRALFLIYRLSVNATT